jgi:dihydropteroate synthase
VDCAGKDLDLSRPRLMGVLNVTPDSFSDGGDFFSVDKACSRARQMAAEGAAIIDVGGESTRPGAEPVPAREEIRRVIPVIEALASDLSVPISIDTRKPEVMRAAVSAGAGMINDVNALQAPGAMEAALAAEVPVCLMHKQGEPGTMQQAPSYRDVVGEVCDFLLGRARDCERAGIGRERLVLDPGFGFGKTAEHNLRLLRHLDKLVSYGYPVLAGLSRKSMIGMILGLDRGERLYPGIALAVLAVWQGASIIRTHDVLQTRLAVEMCQAVRAVDA